MKKIGIELNNVVRNLNYQVMKYYKKDINPEFDERTVSANKTSIIEDIPFESSDARNTFMFTDYPYEIFGCARVVERNLSNTINEWLINLADEEDENYDVSFFSLRENDLSIPSTYYFLSKIATRVKTMHFPTNNENIWDLYDIIVTTNPDLVKNKPEGKVVILIEKEDNTDVKESADYVYTALSDAIKDNPFIGKTEDNTETKNESTSIFGKIKNWFK